MIRTIFSKRKFYNYPESADIQSCFRVKLWNLFLQHPDKDDNYFFRSLDNYAKTLIGNLWHQYLSTPTLFSLETGEFRNKNYEDGAVVSSSLAEIESISAKSVIDQVDGKIFAERLESGLPDKTQTLLVNTLNFTMKAPRKASKKSNNRKYVLSREIRKKFGYSTKEFRIMSKQIEKMVEQIEQGVVLPCQRPGEASQLLAKEMVQ